MARITRIAPHHLAGLTIQEYRDSGLADEVLGHLEALVLAEQREIEQATGKRQSIARRRPESKKEQGQ